MAHVLIVVDMQNDFISGPLGTPEAKAIVPYVKQRIAAFNGVVYFTQDTHDEHYLETEEGHHLPVVHCQKGSDGHRLHESLEPLVNLKQAVVIQKDTFGSKSLIEHLQKLDKQSKIESVELLGLCTDICVISNALLIKAYFPNVPLIVDAEGSAGVTPKSHHNALEAMKMCQINIKQ